MARKGSGFKRWYKGQMAGAPDGFALSKADRQGLKKQWKGGDRAGAKAAYGDMVSQFQPGGTGGEADPEMTINPLEGMVSDPLSANARNPIYGQVNQNMLDLINRAGGQQFDLSQFGAAPSMRDFGAQGQQVQDSIYNQNKTLIDKNFNERREQLSQELAMKGIPVGSEAHQKEMNRFDDNYNAQLTSARQSAIQAGTQEQQRLYDNAMNARQNQIGEYAMQHGMPLQELGAYGQLFGQQGMESGQQALYGQQEKMLGLGQQYDLEKMQKQFGYDTKLQAQQGKIAASMPRGGGGGGADPMALANLKHSQAKELMQMGQAYDMMNRQNMPDGSQSGKNSATNAAIMGGTAAILGG